MLFVYAVKIIQSPTQTVLSFKVEIRANGPVKYEYEYIPKIYHLLA